VIDTPAFSRLGLGITGPHASFMMPRQHSIRLIKEAVGLGVTTFDTGPAYGRGEGEKRLGEALSGIPRDKVFVSTKAGIHAGKYRDFSPGAIEMSLKGSLNRLRTSHVDLLLLHGPAASELTDKLIRHLVMLRDRGLARHIGVCGRGTELDAALDVEAFDAIMAPVNSSLSQEAQARLTRAHEAKVSVIGIEAMAGAQAKPRAPRSIGDFWYLARSAKQRFTGHAPEQQAETREQALDRALAHPATDSILCLTTKQAHLAANAQRAGLEAKPAIT
jgi:aryl-alcohol dehydrogenase-like predicted oxidoreductase